MQTRISQLLGAQYPIIQGGMAYVADARLAAAVSQAGGLGVIGGGAEPPEVVAREIQTLRSLTDQPFGVNIMLMSPHAAELAKLVVQEHVPVVLTGAGSPGPFLETWKKADITVIPVIASVAHAIRMQRLGADAVVAEGCEAGGHIGELTTMTLTPQVVDHVDIPVIAAGGIADRRGVAAALMLGAEGVQCGTCFLVANECNVHKHYKEKILEAKDIGTVVTGGIRSLKGPLTRGYLEREKQGASKEELEAFAVGALRCAVREGDREKGSFMAGQIAGMVSKRRSVQEILDELKEGFSCRMPS